MPMFEWLARPDLGANEVAAPWGAEAAVLLAHTVLRGRNRIPLDQSSLVIN